jgi:hypothetical protein
VYQRVMDTFPAERRKNRDRLRQLVRNSAHEVDVFCSHDRSEFDAAVGREPRTGTSIQSISMRYH